MNNTVLITEAHPHGKGDREKLLAEGHEVFGRPRVDRMADLEQQGATAIAMDISKDEEIVAAVEKIKASSGG